MLLKRNLKALWEPGVSPQGKRCGGQSVPVKHARFFDINVQESLLLFEPPAEGGFPEAGMPEIRKCMP